jgi:hypothetical protein
MLSWLWNNSKSEDEWVIWEEWQRAQPPVHYEKSAIYEYFIAYDPQFIPPANNYGAGANSNYYWYCFGQFTPFIATPYNGGGDLVGYVYVLLNLYDVCKGVSRRITGDPVGISLLRKVAKNRTLSFLHEHDFSQYDYDYTRLHAHTVVQYSLSTLIMRFVANYIAALACNKIVFPIQSNKCKQAYNGYIFGDHRKVSDSTTVNMNKNFPIKNDAITIQNNNNNNKPNHSEHRNFSWPNDKTNLSKCSVCKRVCENLWGKFNICLDCHVTRVCSRCGGHAIIIAPDGLPKCVLHQNVDLQSNQI